MTKRENDFSLKPLPPRLKKTLEKNGTNTCSPIGIFFFTLLRNLLLLEEVNPHWLILYKFVQMNQTMIRF